VKGKLPVLEVASVRLLSVVDLPEEGLPTRAMSGSRGIVCRWEGQCLEGSVGGSDRINELGPRCSRVHCSYGIMFGWRGVSRTAGTNGGLATLLRRRRWEDLDFSASMKFVIDKHLDSSFRWW